jgi:hypothetical protein
MQYTVPPLTKIELARLDPQDLATVKALRAVIETHFELFVGFYRLDDKLTGDVADAIKLIEAANLLLDYFGATPVDTPWE